MFSTSDWISAIIIVVLFCYILTFGIGFAIGDAIMWSGIDQLEGEAVNELRPDYDLGDCRELRGHISVILFFVDDHESHWTMNDIVHFTSEEIMPALEFLEEQFDYHSGPHDFLAFEIVETHSGKTYHGDVITSVRETGLCTVDVLHQMARTEGYPSDEAWMAAKQEQYGTEIVCLTFFNKGGAGYALNPPRGEESNPTEHCIVFARDRDSTSTGYHGFQASLIAAEILYLYGGESLDATPEREALAESRYADDVMLHSYYSVWDHDIDDATAFYIGWIDEAPRALYLDGWNVARGTEG